jgi:hypothetical protein
MQDRPDVFELLDAVRRFLEEQAVPALEGTRKFHARVAANVLAIVGRELREGEAFARLEWRRLAALLDLEPTSEPAGGEALAAAVTAANETLAARIRAGDADAGAFRAAVLEHLRATATEKLQIANPTYDRDA